MENMRNPRKAFRINKYQGKCPCYQNCTGTRSAVCHATCEEYICWDQERKRQKRKRRFKAIMMAMLKKREEGCCE